MSRSKTYDTEVEKWFEPVRRGWKLACCDCHLVHTVDFRIINSKRPRLEMRMRRDERATAAMRRRPKAP